MSQLSLDDFFQQDILNTLPGRLAYIDECGNFGFDFSAEDVSTHYTLCAVVVENTKLDALHKAVAQVKRDNGFANSEMKSSLIGNNYQRRNRIIAQLMGVDFRIVLLIADKRVFVDDSPLKNWKETFVKYLHKRLHLLLYHAYPKLKIIEDEFGSSEFQDSFRKYVAANRPKPNLLNEYDFDYCNSKDELLVQLADIVGGSINKKLTDTNSPDYFEMLKGKILVVEEFPNKNEPYWGTLGKNDYKFSNEVFNLAIKCADDYIAKNERNEELDIRIQVAFLRYLRFYVLNISPISYISSSKLLSVLNEYTAVKISRDFLFRRVIAPLRDHGIILASCTHGYKLPISVEDITTYLNQTHTVVAPMLHRMEICRTLIIQVTNGSLDVLNDPAFLRYKSYFD